jgi:ATP-dependent helicase HrpA
MSSPLVIRYPESLPVSQRKEEIAELIRNHPVVIVAGETGSGKTTQLPKICLELGRGRAGIIGHTQPRRVAASSVAARIAEELEVPLGKEVGFQVRFTDTSSKETLLKLMTDGVLLAEIVRDRLLKRYDTLIIDEAHERSLNIDFLLGYLKRILPQRPDLKVIITSATIDIERFSRHFDNAPTIVVSGRSYPVEVLYRPAEQDEEGEWSLSQAVLLALRDIEEAERAAKGAGRGDVLVFLPGERDIREISHLLRKEVGFTGEVLPLYARLGMAEQRRIFEPGRETGRTAGGAGHQRGRDLAYRARHPLCDRQRPGAYFALQPPLEDPAPAGGAHLAGQCHAAGRTLRPGGSGHLLPALQRGRIFRGGRRSPCPRSSAPTSRR